jgi:hypothetical protein
VQEFRLNLGPGHYFASALEIICRGSGNLQQKLKLKKVLQTGFASRGGLSDLEYPGRGQIEFLILPLFN